MMIRFHLEFINLIRVPFISRRRGEEAKYLRSKIYSSQEKNFFRENISTLFVLFGSIALKRRILRKLLLRMRYPNKVLRNLYMMMGNIQEFRC